MGCGRSALGCGPESSGQPSPTSGQGLATTPTCAATEAVTSSPKQPQALSLQCDSSGPQGHESEAQMVAITAMGRDGTALGLQYSSTTAALPTEELASGRSQLERGYQQLPLGVALKDWDDLHVRMWLLTLPQVLRTYTDMLCSPGGLLLEWSDELLTEAGVSNVFHRKQLLEYVRQLQADGASRQQGQGGAETPRAMIPGSIDSPPTDGSGGCSGANSGGKLPRTPQLQRPKQAGMDSETGFLASRTPATSTSLRRLHSIGNSAQGSVNSEEGRSPSRRNSTNGTGGITGGGGGPAAKGDADLLSEYKEGLLEQGLSSLKLLVREAGSMCPWPGDAAAQLLSTLLDMGEKALINRRNWQQLNVRAVDLLQLIASNKQLHADTHTYRSIMHRLINTLKGIREYYTDYTNRNWLSRIVAVGRDQYMFTQLWDALGALVADASLGLQVAAAEGQDTAAKALQRLQERQARYDNEEGRLRSRIEDLGGFEALLRDPGQLAEVANHLGVGDQLTLHKIQEAVSLLEADRAEGVHSLIPHPDLRILWRKCFASLEDVSWALWWEAFPTELSRVPVEQLVIAKLSARLSNSQRRRAFERRIDVSAAGRISVVDLRHTVPAEADLQEVVARLTERLSMDGEGDTAAATAASGFSDGNKPVRRSSDLTLDGGSICSGDGSDAYVEEAAFADTCMGTATPESSPSPPASSSDAPAPYTGLEPRCSLPALDNDRFVGRGEDVRQVSNILMATSGGVPRQRRRTSDTSIGLWGGGGGISGGGGGTALLPFATKGLAGGEAAPATSGRVHLQERSNTLHRSHALCIVAEPGMGKSALAVAAARRLWEDGNLPGGAYYVDLQGADCRTEMVARFASALGVAKAEYGDAGGTAGISQALRSLAARGVLLLVLDGVDCLDDTYDMEPQMLNKVADIYDGDHDGGAAGAQDGGGGGLRIGQDTEPEAVLSELLAVVPSARVLLTSTEPLELRSREVEYFWLGALPEPAAVALVQDLARCLTWEEASQLVGACGMSPLALRIAASAVAAGALTLRDAMARARRATALVTCTPRVNSPGCSGSGNISSNGAPGLSGMEKAGGGSMGPVGPLIMTSATPRLLRSQSPSSVQVSRSRLTKTPTIHRTDGGSGQASSRQIPSFARSMSFLLRTSHANGSANASGSSSSLPPLLLQQTFGSPGGSGRTYGSGAAVAAALLAALNEEHRTALVQLSILPGSWDEDTASALLDKPPYAVRALLDVLLGYSLIVNRGYNGHSVRGSGSLGSTMSGCGQGCYSLMPGMFDAARAQLAELDKESRVALQCRFVDHVLLQFLRADRLYCEGAVRAAMHLASEQRQDVQAMLLVAAKCADQDRMFWGTIGVSRLPALAASPLFSALVLDTSAEMDAFWRAVADVSTAAVESKAPPTETGRYDTLAALAARVLAQTLYKQARYEEAEVRWRGALLQAQRIHGPGSLEAAACHRGLGLALSALRRHGEAEKEHKAALRLKKAALGDRHADVANSLSDLARVMRQTGRYREAEAAYQEVLQVRRELLGERHPTVADTYISVGIAVGLQKRYLEEEDFYRKALSIRQHTLGPDHPQVAQALNNIGTSLSSQGKHAMAEQLFREALAIKRKVLGATHHAVGSTLNSIARALNYQSKLPEAEAFCRKAVAVLEASLGATHPSVTTAVNNLTYLLKRQGKDTQGAAVYKTDHRRSTQHNVAQAPQPSGDGAPAVTAPVLEAEVGLPVASEATAAGSTASASTPVRLGKPPLAPQGNVQGRQPQQKHQGSAEPEPLSPLEGTVWSQAPRPRPLDISMTVSQGLPDAEGVSPVLKDANGVREGLAHEAGLSKLNARLGVSSLQQQILVEAARAVQRELQGSRDEGA